MKIRENVAPATRDHHTSYKLDYDSNSYAPPTSPVSEEPEVAYMLAGSRLKRCSDMIVE